MLGLQPVAAVDNEKALPLEKPSLCPNTMLRKPVQLKDMFYPWRWRITSGLLQVRDWHRTVHLVTGRIGRETSIKFLLLMEELVMTLPLPWNCASRPFLWIKWELSKTNIVTSCWICRRHEAAALERALERSPASQWDYYLLSLELTIKVEP